MALSGKTNIKSSLKIAYLEIAFFFQGLLNIDIGSYIFLPFFCVLLIGLARKLVKTCPCVSAFILNEKSLKTTGVKILHKIQFASFGLCKK